MMTIGEERLANGVLTQLRRIADQLEKSGAAGGGSEKLGNRVLATCLNCQDVFHVDERAVVYVCPHCGTMTRVCENCHHFDPDIQCDKCPFVMGRED